MNLLLKMVFIEKIIVEDGLEIIMREDDDSKYFANVANFAVKHRNFEIFLSGEIEL